MTQPIVRIYSCPLDELNLSRARALVPFEYLKPWDWFQSMEEVRIDYLPYGEHAPKEIPYPICRLSGIHNIGAKWIKGGWKGYKRYALSVHTSSHYAGKSQYKDGEVIDRGDGTWTFDYSEQSAGDNKRGTNDYNALLMNCLEDGVPVGVIVGNDDGTYTVKGLGFVERYNSRGNTFTIHGPINSETEAAQIFYMLPKADLSLEDERRIEELTRLKIGNVDERKRAYMRTVRRERQDKFRAAVYSAYQGRCAISGTGLSDVLQAAHIDNYRGKQSQIVNNGILLRADLHLLYDANLMGIEPISHDILLAEDAQVEPYESMLKGVKLRLPNDPKLRPDDDLLRLHFEQYEAQNNVA